jgi:hypothetical protein
MSVLTPNSIIKVLSLVNESRKIFAIGAKMQVLDIKHEENNSCITLSDGVFYHENFIIRSKNINFQLYDVIYLQNVSLAGFLSENIRQFLLLKYDFDSSEERIIGNPTPYPFQIKLEENQEQLINSGIKIKSLNKDNFKLESPPRNNNIRSSIIKNSGAIRTTKISLKSSILKIENENLINKENQEKINYNQSKGNISFHDKSIIINSGLKEMPNVDFEEFFNSDEKLPSNKINKLSSSLFQKVGEYLSDSSKEIFNVSSKNKFLIPYQKQEIKKEEPESSGKILTKNIKAKNNKDLSQLKEEDEEEPVFEETNSCIESTSDHENESEKEVKSSKIKENSKLKYFKELENTLDITEFVIEVFILNYEENSPYRMKLLAVDSRGDIGYIIIPYDKLKKFSQHIKLFHKFIISNGRIDKNSRVEITLSQKSTLEVVNWFSLFPKIRDKEVNLQKEYSKLSELTKQKRNDFKLLLYVCQVVETRQVMTNNKVLLPIKMLVVADDSRTKTNFNLLRDFSNLDVKKGDVIYVQNPVRINDGFGWIIETGGKSIVQVVPAYSIVRDLLEKIAQFNKPYTYLTSQCWETPKSINIEEITQLLLEKNLNYEESFELKASIKQLLTDYPLIYKGCPNLDCQRRIYISEGWFFCSHCNKEFTGLEVKYYFFFRIELWDHSGSLIIIPPQEIIDKMIETFLGRKLSVGQYIKTGKCKKEIKQELIDSFAYKEILFKGKFTYKNVVKAGKTRTTTNSFVVTDFYPLINENNKNSYWQIKLEGIKNILNINTE